MKTSSLENKARRGARGAGLLARKSRLFAYPHENLGGFMLLEPSTGIPLAGFHYDLEAQAVIDYCRGDTRD